MKGGQPADRNYSVALLRRDRSFMEGHFCLQYVAPGAQKEVECVEFNAFLFSHRLKTSFADEVRLVTNDHH